MFLDRSSGQKEKVDGQKESCDDESNGPESICFPREQVLVNLRGLTTRRTVTKQLLASLFIHSHPLRITQHSRHAS